MLPEDLRAELVDLAAADAERVVKVPPVDLVAAVDSREPVVKVARADSVASAVDKERQPRQRA